MTATLVIPELDFDPYAPGTLLDPYPMHEAIRDAGPVVRLRPYRRWSHAAATSRSTPS